MKNTHAQEVSTGTSGSIEPELVELEINTPGGIPDVVLAVLAVRPQIGGADGETDVREWRGNSSSALHKRGGIVTSNSDKDPRPLVPVMGNLSTQGQLEENVADVVSVDGNTPQMGKAYADMTVPELQAECKVRELHISGKKDDLIQRLTEYDEEYTEDDGFEDDDEFEEDEEDADDDFE